LLITAKKGKLSVRAQIYFGAHENAGVCSSFTYGRVEARIKLPGRQGLWPAFLDARAKIWTTVGFPYCGEIDIMEYVNTDPMLHGTMHWAYNGESSGRLRRFQVLVK
jgi:beta-glucanase (GH16 family)